MRDLDIRKYAIKKAAWSGKVAEWLDANILVSCDCHAADDFYDFASTKLSYYDWE